MATICVFCGSRSGNQPAFTTAAIATGTAIARSGHTLVYGAGNIGLMGAVADAALAAGGRVTGVIPDHLVRQEVCHRNLSELQIVTDMQQRKRLMCDRSDGFLVLPGGIGTLDELSEVLCWNQLRLHLPDRIKPLAFLDTAGFWSPFLTFLGTVVESGFMSRNDLDAVLVGNDPLDLVTRLVAQATTPI
jgi:uncharacterized protein (TIGR00730 family)